MSQRSRANCRWYKTSLDCYHMFSVTIMANNEIEATVTYSFLCGIRGFSRLQRSLETDPGTFEPFS